MKRFAHKTLLLLTVLSLVLLALPITARADGGSGENEFTQTIDGYQVTLVFEKPASLGENQIHVLVMDAMNMPVPQAGLEVSVVEAQAEHAEEEPDAEAGTMSGMSSMAEQPTAEVGVMSGMSAQPAEHDQMGMVALTAGHESGEYDGQVSIESAGDLTIRLHITVQGELMEVDFPLHIAKSNNGAIVLGSFFAVNVALIAAAVVLKPKPVTVNLLKKA